MAQSIRSHLNTAKSKVAQSVRITQQKYVTVNPVTREHNKHQGGTLNQASMEHSGDQGGMVFDSFKHTSAIYPGLVKFTDDKWK